MKKEEKSKQVAGPGKKQIGGLLIAGGVLGSVYLLVKGKKNIVSWVIPLGMVAAGLNIVMLERHAQITETGDEILAQLNELDPVARAQVVKYVADQEIEKISS